MRLKLICCEVFLREACLCIALSPHTVDPEFIPKGAHDMPSCLREMLQGRIDETEKQGVYDAILLGYGLCGNGIVGLKSGNLPLVIPRAHDCCTILLGSRQRFIECFGDNLCAQWSSAGYVERGEGPVRGADAVKIPGLDVEYNELIEKYGEENAEYIWSAIHPADKVQELIYIDIPETSNPAWLEQIKREAENQGKTVRVIQGSIKMIQSLICGEWDEEDFLVVPPGFSVKGVYDQNLVIKI